MLETQELQCINGPLHPDPYVGAPDALEQHGLLLEEQ